MGIERLICLGDIATLGPYPGEAVQLIRERTSFVVSGNHDRLAARPDELRAVHRAPTPEARRTVDLIRWAADQLSAGQRRYLASLPAREVVTLADGSSVFCCHGSPGSRAEFLPADAGEDELRNALRGVTQSLIAAGHTHVPMLRRVDDRILVNPGSVGLAESASPGTGERRSAPWAEYAVIAASDAGISVTLRRVPYDTGELVRAARDAEMPHGEWFISHFSRG